MNNKMNIKTAIILLLGTLLVASCATPPPVKEMKPDYMPELTKTNFQDTILKQKGASLVLFHDNTYAPSKQLLNILKTRAELLYLRVNFYSFIWPIDQNGEAYDLEVLPTLVYYNNGEELDRMKGLPASFDNKTRVISELDLWLQRTVLGLPANFLSGEFKYRYNNTPTLQVSNY